MQKAKRLLVQLLFKNKEHEKFYIEYLPKCRYQDAYHKALVYCLGIDDDTRKCVNRIYDFKTGCVKTEFLQEGWITSGSAKIVRMAHHVAKKKGAAYGIIFIPSADTALTVLAADRRSCRLEEEVTQKTIALSIKTSKLTADVLKAALRKFLSAQSQKGYYL